jgi:hypothetical protein
MDKLAITTARHITAFLARDAQSVALAGGVWTSEIAVATFVEALRRHCPAAEIDTDALPITPLDGALALATRT